MADPVLYIHIPFCKKKCLYCDFFSVTHLSKIECFVQTLKTEIQLYKNKIFTGETIKSVYLGGGTPSLLSVEQIKDILQTIHENFSLSANIQISVEVNPESVTPEKLLIYRKAGINRITFGVQSFLDKELKILGRIHDVTESKQAILAAKQAGFENVGIDLIYAIPGQTQKDWKQSLEQAVNISPDHISMYGLTYEEATPLRHMLEQGDVISAPEELEREMYLQGKKTLEAAGYDHYEISNFARPGHESIHNMSYWDGTHFLGLGPSAHSFDGQRRWWNVSDLDDYCSRLKTEQLPVQEYEKLDNTKRHEELILLGLRRKRGINLSEWKFETGGDFLQSALKAIDRLGGIDNKVLPFQNSTTEKYFGFKDKYLFLTEQGILLYDEICVLLSDCFDS